MQNISTHMSPILILTWIFLLKFLIKIKNLPPPLPPLPPGHGSVHIYCLLGTFHCENTILIFYKRSFLLCNITMQYKFYKLNLSWTNSTVYPCVPWLVCPFCRKKYSHKIIRKNSNYDFRAS